LFRLLARSELTSGARLLPKARGGSGERSNRDRPAAIGSPVWRSQSCPTEPTWDLRDRHRNLDWTHRHCCRRGRCNRAVTSLALRALQALQWRRAVPASANTWDFPASVFGVPGALAVTPDEIAWQPRRPRTAARIMARWDDLPSLEIQSVPTVVPLCRIRLSTDSDREPQDILVSARCTVVATALMRRFEPLGPVISGHSRSHRRRPVVASEFGYRSGWSISTCRGSSV
jgi:hypothetical protein